MNNTIRRHIRDIIDKNDITILQEYQDEISYLTDPVYSALDSNALDVAYYLVDTLHIASKHGLRRALECSQTSFAIHLKELNYPLIGNNHIYNLEAIKLTHSWGFTFDDKAINQILHSWNGKEILERLQYLYNNSYTYIPEIDELYGIQDNVALFFYQMYDSSDYLMVKACKHGWFQCIDYLIHKGTLFTPTHFEEIAGAIVENEPTVNRLRELYTTFSVNDMIIIALKATEDLGETYLFCRQHYPDIWSTLVTEKKLQFINNLMSWDFEYNNDNEFILAMITDDVLGLNDIIEFIQYNKDIPNSYLFYRKRFPKLWSRLVNENRLGFIDKYSIDLDTIENPEFKQALVEDGIII